jgi:hypothetical protein
LVKYVEAPVESYTRQELEDRFRVGRRGQEVVALLSGEWVP